MDKLEQRIEALEEANRDNMQDLMQRLDEANSNIRELAGRVEKLEKHIEKMERAKHQKDVSEV